MAGNTHYMIVVAEGAGSAMDVGKRDQGAIWALTPVSPFWATSSGAAVPPPRTASLATRMGYRGGASCWPRARPTGSSAPADEQIVNVDIDEGLAMKKTLNAEEFEVMTVMTGV